jgi:hypothetical protein
VPPVKPVAHTQVTDDDTTKQEPPFWHGFGNGGTLDAHVIEPGGAVGATDELV